MTSLPNPTSPSQPAANIPTPFSERFDASGTTQRSRYVLRSPGQGDPVLCMGGWGTYCHGNPGNLARGLTDRYQVIIFDYRGIGDSSGDPDIPATIDLHAKDAIALLDHLGLKHVHLMGLV